MRRSPFLLITLITLLSLIFYVAQSLSTTTTTSKLDMFNRRDQLLAANDYMLDGANFQDVNNNGTDVVTDILIAEYQTAFWISVILTGTMIGAVWFVSKIDYSQDTMLYASELKKE